MSKTFELVMLERDKNGKPTGQTVSVTTNNAVDLYGFFMKHTPNKMKEQAFEDYYAVPEKVKKK